MGGFAEWLFLVERSLVDAEVLDSYEREFQHGLEALIRAHETWSCGRISRACAVVRCRQKRTMQPVLLGTIPGEFQVAFPDVQSTAETAVELLQAVPGGMARWEVS